MMLRLAAPHTWAASVMPALLGTALAAREGVSDPLMGLLLTAVCVLMQSAVNTFNDYSDFIKGTDTLENSPDADDAVMVYDRPSPRRVLFLGFAFLLAAALCAVRLCPNVREYLVPSHASYEIGYRKAMEAMELEPMLLLGMRLGEGSGCPLAFQILSAACGVMNGMATFDQAGINDDYLEDFKDTDMFTVEKKA